MRVVLVGLGSDVTELRALVSSAGYDIADELVQRRDRPDPRTFVGRGKLDTLRDLVRETGADAVVLAGALRASQHYELERALGVQCFDRLRVILEIFAQRASGRESKLQVELAMLQYEIPILREWIHRASVGERPGLMAGGEYRVDAYYETVKRKMKKVRDDLDSVRKERAIRRDHRQRRRFYQVAITGYANAGKSSLFNALSGERVVVEDRLFTTLATTTRAIEDVRRRILLTDTVGFVSDVPVWLVEAFHSTLEEVYASDLVLLLLDASDSLEDVRAKTELAARVLLPGIPASRVQPVLTKADLVDADRLARCADSLRESEFHRTPIFLSIRSGEGVQGLRELIVEELRYPIELTLRIRANEESPSFLHWLHERTDVLAIAYGPQSIDVRLRCHEADLGRIRRDARILSDPSPVTSD